MIDRFERQQHPIHQHMVQVMTSFLAGLFVGEGKFRTPDMAPSRGERFFPLDSQADAQTTPGVRDRLRI